MVNVYIDPISLSGSLSHTAEMNQQIPKHLSVKDLHAWLQKDSLKPILVDVREDHELDIVSFPLPVVHLPLSRASLWAATLNEKLPHDQPIVVICHAGVRSWDFGIWLIEQGWAGQVWSLDGGIDAWSEAIDHSMPRY